MTMRTPTAYVETRIRQLITERDRAIGAKDVDGILAHYAEDVVLFDVKPPYRINGAESFRRVWEQCLPCFPDGFGIESRDVRIIVSGDVAVVHSLFRFTGLPADHPAALTWIRSTAVWQKSQGRWRILHDHLSVPFDPQTSRAVFTLEP